MKKSSHRQTDLSLEEVCEILDNEIYNMHPRCLYINELGVIAEEEKSEEARKKLHELILSETGRNEKFAAFCHLCTICGGDGKTLRVLKEFISEKENEEFVNEAKMREIIVPYMA